MTSNYQFPVLKHAEYFEKGEVSEATEVFALGCVILDFLCFNSCDAAHAYTREALAKIRSERVALIKSGMVWNQVGKQGPLHNRCLMGMQTALSIIST